MQRNQNHVRRRAFQIAVLLICLFAGPPRALAWQALQDAGVGPAGAIPTHHFIALSSPVFVDRLVNPFAEDDGSGNEQQSATADQNEAPQTAASPASAAAKSRQFCPPIPPGSDRSVSWKLVLPNILCDQKQIWTYPWRLAHGHYLVATAAVVGTTAGLILLDPSIAPYFRRTTTFKSFNTVFSGTNTSLGIELFPIAFYGLSLIKKDTYGQHTALLVGEAVADSEILDTIMKGATRRLRPADIPPNGNFSNSWYKSKAFNGSFPSGHAIAAFSVATIFARRYRSHRWVPYVAYGTAAFIGFSRLPLSAHFPSDVFLAGALGYSIANFAVLH